MNDSQFAEMIRNRDKVCRVCYSAGSDVHHIFSRKNQKTRHLEENGIFLCRNCHNAAHIYGRRWVEAVEPLMVVLYGADWLEKLEKKVYQ